MTATKDDGTVERVYARLLDQRSLNRLVDVHPALIEVARLGLTYSPHSFFVSEGARSIDRQRELMAKGFSKTLDSKHLIQADGHAHAFDLIASGDLDGDGDVDAQDTALVWDRRIYTEISAGIKRAAVDLGTAIRWGGDFKNFFDGPHYELA